MKTCQWCDDPFEAKVGYQIYCSSECREEATKEKIAQRYLVARRNRMMGKKRNCKSCGSPLSDSSVFHPSGLEVGTSRDPSAFTG